MSQVVGPLYTRRQAQLYGWRARAHSFAQFMNAVNIEVLEVTGHSVRWFPDWDWSSAFESGRPAAEVARQFLADQNEIRSGACGLLPEPTPAELHAWRL